MLADSIYAWNHEPHPSEQLCEAGIGDAAGDHTLEQDGRTRQEMKRSLGYPIRDGSPIVGKHQRMLCDVRSAKRDV